MKSHLVLAFAETLPKLMALDGWSLVVGFGGVAAGGLAAYLIRHARTLLRVVGALLVAGTALLAVATQAASARNAARDGQNTLRVSPDSVTAALVAAQEDTATHAVAAFKGMLVDMVRKGPPVVGVRYLAAEESYDVSAESPTALAALGRTSILFETDPSVPTAVAVFSIGVTSDPAKLDFRCSILDRTSGRFLLPEVATCVSDPPVPVGNRWAVPVRVTADTRRTAGTTLELGATYRLVGWDRSVPVRKVYCAPSLWGASSLPSFRARMRLPYTDLASPTYVRLTNSGALEPFGQDKPQGVNFTVRKLHGAVEASVSVAPLDRPLAVLFHPSGWSEEDRRALYEKYEKLLLARGSQGL